MAAHWHEHGMSEVTSVGQAAGPFRSLRSFNYRLWVVGSLVSNVGTWFQRIAQDWLVLTQLTHHNATAVGVVMALQTGPTLLLLPLTGYAADHFDRRKLLIWTQASLALLALVLGVLTITGLVTLWQLYGLALLFGCVTAFDAPARQVFVSQLVPDEDLANAVALNSTSFNGARLIGPALAGVMIGAVGSGWAILINAVTFVAVLASLTSLRQSELLRQERPVPGSTGLADGFRYIRAHGDLKITLSMIFLIGTFALNFPIFVSTMTVSAFGRNATGYGLLMSAMAIGAVGGGVFYARLTRPSLVTLHKSAVLLGLGLLLAAVAPTYWLFAVALVVVGAAAVGFTTSSSSFMQLATEPAIRGRVMSVRLAVGMGTAPLGAPLVGWVADAFGARWAIVIGAVACVGAFGVALAYKLKRRAVA